MYECISQELAAIGIIHGAKSCRDKIKKLKQDFKKLKDHNNKSGNGRKTSKWYDRLNALLGHRPAFVGTANTIASSTMGWEDAMAVELSQDDDELGNGLFPIELEISELSPPEIHGSASSSPFPTTKRKGKRTRDDSFLDTITVMDDRRALASKENEDRHAMANMEMHDERLLHAHKAQESQDQLLQVMADSAARQVEVAARQVEVAARQVEVAALQVEQQNSFQAGLLGVLSELVKSNRPPIKKKRKTCRR
ncbi:hypothetical protein OYC64_018508 [Pagothenia borchgrevinki]|uniref:Myb/SANT-like DNA-binding domain-containing protein n=1 Tax=Pagothenia borchgrevinki TaxID=8213 RepID=A0ABD2GQ68_PAGBO